MIGAELLNKIKEDRRRKKDDETDGKKEAQRKQEEIYEKRYLRFLVVGALMFFLIIVLAALMSNEDVQKSDSTTATLKYEAPSTAAFKSKAPSVAALRSEYAVYFEKPCLQSTEYDDGNGKIRAGWKDRIQRGIIKQARKYDRLSERKKLYAAKVNNCEKIIKSSQRLRTSPEHIPVADYKAEIEKYVIDRCYRKLVKKVRPDLSAPDFRQIEIIKSAMWRDVEKTTKQILPKVHKKTYKERMTVYESAMGWCRLP